MGVLIINDPHFNEKPPGRRTSTYLKQIAGKMLECAKLANEQGLYTIINGDIFHSKKHITYLTLRVAISVLKRFDVPPFLVLGNHDIIGGAVHTKVFQPVGVLFESGYLRHLDSPVALDGITVIPKDYSEPFETGDEIWDVGPKASDEFRILVAHASLNPESGLRKKVKGEFDYCFYGHIHWPEGIDRGFVNFGSIARTTIDTYNQREVAVTILDENGVTPYKLKNQKHWTEIYTDEDPIPEGVRDSLLSEDEVDDFIAHLTFDKPENIEDFVAGLESDVRERVRHYIGGL